MSNCPPLRSSWRFTGKSPPHLGATKWPQTTCQAFPAGPATSHTSTASPASSGFALHPPLLHSSSPAAGQTPGKTPLSPCTTRSVDESLSMPGGASHRSQSTFVAARDSRPAKTSSPAYQHPHPFAAVDRQECSRTLLEVSSWASSLSISSFLSCT